MSGALALLAVSIAAIPARADVIGAGDAVVTGFSGVKTADPTPAAGDPFDEDLIDLDGASMQIHRLEPDGPPDGQLISAPVTLKVKARDVGQVFAIGLDTGSEFDLSDSIPNIFLGATSAFGLQIVLPDSDSDGRPERIKNGHPNAEWMPGQFGPGGGPGSVWKVDGRTGAISLFTTIPGNTGPGLGDIVYDRATRQFFVSELDVGLIHRLSGDGTPIDVFDHGEARTAAGLPAMPDDGKAINIKDPAFDALNPDTWGLTPRERRVWGLGLHGGRLYYSVAEGPEIWSVGINLDGSFAGDARREIEVAGTPGNFAITDIAFDTQGYMYIAQRGGLRGSWDYSAFTEANKSVVFRFKRELPDDPATPGTWVPIPDEYAVGFPPDYRNTSGGIALGYGYDEAGKMRKGACNQMIWSTGDNLRNDPALAAELASGGPAVVHGLQGNDRSLIRPDNEPPAQSYFVDYDGQFEDASNSGHVGDVEIWQPCGKDGDGEDYGYVYPPWIGETPPSPPPSDSFNLRLTKVAEPEDCWAGGIGWSCGYTIRVTNTGPGFYFGDITVTDWLPDPPPGAVMHFGPQPPWNCVEIAPTEHQCTHPPVGLYPGESVDLYVVVESPADDPRCYVDNFARIDWHPGFSDADPTDDVDFASAQIPSAPCAAPPPEGEKSNLQINKRAYLDNCLLDGAHYACPFIVEVTNTGPGLYNDKIVVDETLPPAALTATFSPPAEWTCNVVALSYRCERAATPLNAGQRVFLLVIVRIPQDNYGQCQQTNQVRIVEAPGGSDQNTDPLDDDASATANIPSAACLGQQNNLRIDKRAASEMCATGDGGWDCTYEVTATNMGPGVYSGEVHVADDLPDLPGGSSLARWWPAIQTWGCSGAFNFTCRLGSVTMAPGDKVGFWVRVHVPANYDRCDLTNVAQIVVPAVGDTNTDPGDDKDQATATFPPLTVGDVRRCPRMAPKQGVRPEPEPQPEPTVCPTGWTETPIPGKCCPHGTTWDGERCKREDTTTDEPSAQPGPQCWSGWTEIGAAETKSYIRKGYRVRPRRDGNQTIWCAQREQPPPPPPPPPPTLACWSGWIKIDGDQTKAYIRKGYKVRPRREGKQRIWCAQEGGKPPPPDNCPPPAIGKLPNCQCGKGYQGKWPKCTKVDTPPPALDCPPPAVGKLPFCKCGPGYTGKWPKCKEIEATNPADECRKKGWRWSSRGCLPPRNGDSNNKACPFGYVGKPPNCKKLELQLKQKDKENLKKLYDALQKLKKD